MELLQQASFDSWLDYPTILQFEIVLRTRVHYSPLQYTTEGPPPSSYGKAILGTHTYLEAFSSFHLLVYELYRQPSSPLPSDAAIRIDHDNPAGVYFFIHALTTYRCLHDMYSATFKRKPNEGVGHGLPKHLSL